MSIHKENKMKPKSFVRAVLVGVSVLLLSQFGGSDLAQAYKQTQDNVAPQQPIKETSEDEFSLNDVSIESLVYAAVVMAFGVAVLRYLDPSR